MTASQLAATLKQSYERKLYQKLDIVIWHLARTHDH